MILPYYHIDAFADSVFAGNPAGVCPLAEWLPEPVMQSIASENNLPETAFFVPREDSADYDIRWFTPVVEIALCGHATLASAHVVFQHIDPAADHVIFHSMSGRLSVSREDDLLTMDFPATPPIPADMPDMLAGALGNAPEAVLRSEDWVAVYPSQRDIVDLVPDLQGLRGLDLRGVIVTAPGDDADFVSRFFAPKLGIDEDPVTGSAHCTLTPYWAKRLGKSRLRAVQCSRRGGVLYCENRGDRIMIAGHAVPYMIGNIEC